jgi:uncharacterized membrane protein
MWPTYPSVRFDRGGPGNHNDGMLLAVNALLYVSALMLAIAFTHPRADDVPRAARLARVVLAWGGGLTILVALALALAGLWFASAIAGAVAIVVVAVSMWFALARASAPSEDEEEDDDDGGSKFRPRPPQPTKPDCGPSDDLWTEFDAARAGWDRPREPAGT